MRGRAAFTLLFGLLAYAHRCRGVGACRYRSWRAIWHRRCPFPRTPGRRVPSAHRARQSAARDGRARSQRHVIVFSFLPCHATVEAMPPRAQMLPKVHNERRGQWDVRRRDRRDRHTRPRLRCERHGGAQLSGRARGRRSKGHITTCVSAFEFWKPNNWVADMHTIVGAYPFVYHNAGSQPTGVSKPVPHHDIQTTDDDLVM